MEFTVEPIPDESYEGRQIGYMLVCNGIPRFHVSTGGTGDCWNIQCAEDTDDHDVIPMHVCELDELIAALQTLRDSDAHKVHVARWAV